MCQFPANPEKRHHFRQSTLFVFTRCKFLNQFTTKNRFWDLFLICCSEQTAEGQQREHVSVPSRGHSHLPDSTPPAAAAGSARPPHTDQRPAPLPRLFFRWSDSCLLKATVTRQMCSFHFICLLLLVSSGSGGSISSSQAAPNQGKILPPFFSLWINCKLNCSVSAGTSRCQSL